MFPVAGGPSFAVGLKVSIVRPTEDVCAPSLPDFCKGGENDGQDSQFGPIAVMTPEHSSLNVHGILPSRRHRAS